MRKCGGGRRNIPTQDRSNKRSLKEVLRQLLHFSSSQDTHRYANQEASQQDKQDKQDNRKEKPTSSNPNAQRRSCDLHHAAMHGLDTATAER
ncbi:uncharacterized protein [Dermacentor albipictus]|uniref:uncharacterized protein isoform X9 n=1 Tax=Dermacentor albipictus TaxID=60249 RepID=UPI0038FCE3BA